MFIDTHCHLFYEDLKSDLDLVLERAKKMCRLRAEKPLINFFGYKIYYLFSVQHHSHYETAWNMFKDRPLIGHGIKSFRYTCDDYKVN